LKNFLFSTTALAVAGALAFGSDANAAAKPIKMGVGGFMTTEMGFGSNDGDFETTSGDTGNSGKRAAFNNVQDSELYFTGSTKLDSGVTVSITIQLEADQAVADGTSIDESYMKLTGDFGDLRLGSTTGTNSVLKHTAPYVGVAPDGGGSDAYISVPAAVTASNSTNVATSGDANKIAYISPRQGGMAFGMSYTPSTSNLNTAPIVGGNAGTEVDVIEAALSYETKVGTSSVQGDIAAEIAGNDTHSVRAGLKISAGGVTVGGSIRKRNHAVPNDTLGQDAYDLGISYAMGAYTFGLATAVGIAGVGPGLEDKERKWQAGMSTPIDTGVTATLTYINANYNDSGNAGTSNNDGHALIGQIKVSF
jgi:hypothetical protein